MKIYLLIDSPEQVGELNPKCLGDGFDAEQRQVTFTSFDLADVRPMHSAHLCQLFLRPVAFLPELADSFTKGVFDVTGHARILRG